MCHPLNITKAEWSARRWGGRARDGRVGIHVTTTCGVTGKTGIGWRPSPPRAWRACRVRDMCKAVDRGMGIMDVRLLKKDGKTGL